MVQAGKMLHQCCAAPAEAANNDTMHWTTCCGVTSGDCGEHTSMSGSRACPCRHSVAAGGCRAPCSRAARLLHSPSQQHIGLAKPHALRWTPQLTGISKAAGRLASLTRRDRPAPVLGSLATQQCACGVALIDLPPPLQTAAAVGWAAGTVWAAATVLTPQHANQPADQPATGCTPRIAG